MISQKKIEEMVHQLTKIIKERELRESCGMSSCSFGNHKYVPYPKEYSYITENIFCTICGDRK
jgi:hypothetical protein